MSVLEGFERFFNSETEEFNERTTEREQRQDEHYVQHPRLLVRSRNETCCERQARALIAVVILNIASITLSSYRKN